MTNTWRRQRQASRLRPTYAVGLALAARALAGGPALSQAPAAGKPSNFASTHPKILISYDMEGVSGALTPDYVLMGSQQYPVGRKSLTSDVNAAIRGLVKGGAGPIWVQDAHGSGNTMEPDILLNEMDPHAMMDFRAHPYDPYATGIDGSIDAIVCIGAHARPNTPGFMAHTITFDDDLNVNGVEFTEVHIVALSASRWGIPVIMVSGDNVLKDQLTTDFPELEYAVVKTAKSHNEAEPLAAGEAERRIEAAAQQAMQKFRAGQFRPYYLPPPYDFRLSFPDYEEAEGAARNPETTKDGDLAVRFERPTFIAGYEIARASIGMAIQNAMFSMLSRRLASDTATRKVLRELRDAVINRWLDPTKTPEWAKPGSKPPPQAKYWGDT